MKVRVVNLQQTQAAWSANGLGRIREFGNLSVQNSAPTQKIASPPQRDITIPNAKSEVIFNTPKTLQHAQGWQKEQSHSGQPKRCIGRESNPGLAESYEGR